MEADPAPGARDAPLIELLDAPGMRPVGGARIALERKDAALLALLALDGPRPRADTAALLWPDADSTRARNSLRQRLFRLQRAAGTGVVEGGALLRLLPRVRHDLDGLARRLAQDPDAPAGELLGGHDYGDGTALAEWVEHARARWRSRRADLLAGLALQREDEGRLALALRYAERLAADEPLQEHAHRRVMRLHYLRGDRGAALAAFERCRQVLASRLQATPDAETLALVRTIAAADASRSAAPARACEANFGGHDTSPRACFATSSAEASCARSGGAAACAAAGVRGAGGSELPQPAIEATNAARAARTPWLAHASMRPSCVQRDGSRLGQEPTCPGP